MSARLYTKGTPYLQPNEGFKGMGGGASPQESITEQTEVSHSYRKGEPTLTPKSFIVIFSGGRDTEVNYFKIISNSRNFPDIKILTFVEDSFKKGGEPRIFDFAEEKVSYYNSSSSENTPDSFFLITDIDSFGEHIIRNRQRCQDLSISLIVSNPCFEVWLYYSKHSDRFEDFVVPDDKSKLSGELKKFVNKSVKGGLNCKKAIFDIRQNIKNAKKNCSYDSETALPSLFSTDMFILAEKILPYIDKGLEEFNAKRE